MSKLRCHISISLDGFVAGPNQSEENPLGEGGERLHDWVVPLAAWRQSHGKQGGEVNESARIVEEARENVGAGIMGRKMFGPIGGGAWGDGQRTGWWGDGARLFDNLGDAEVELKQVRAVEAPGVTHLKYRVVT